VGVESVRSGLGAEWARLVGNAVICGIKRTHEQNIPESVGVRRVPDPSAETARRARCIQQRL
jgi:hypothetical protein